MDKMIIKIDKNDLNFAKLFKKSENTFEISDGKIKGVAVPYGEKTNDWRKISFSKGAFKKSEKVPFFINHESYDVLKMVGAVEFVDTPNALRFSGIFNLKDTAVIEKVIPLIEMGVLWGVSVGINLIKKEDVYDPDSGERIETIITEAEIYELSIVTFQAFDSARIEMQKEYNMGEKENSQEVTPENEDVTNPEENSEAEVEDESTEENSENGTEETSEDENSENESTEENSEAEPEVEENFEAVKKQNDEFKKQIAERDEEIKKLNAEKNENSKKEVLNKLITKGIVHKAQFDRIMNNFASAEAIEEFYKDIPASISVEPKGEGAHEANESEVKGEFYKNLSTQTPSLSKEDYEKYNQ